VAAGIAAYKAVDLASKLTAAQAHVQTIMTDGAQQFVGPKSFEAVTSGPVFTTLWTPAEAYKSAHISLVDWADIIVVAPATADILAKAACGICDDLLSTLLCVCWEKPILLVPAMNSRMWANPAVQRNVETLRQRGCEMVGPAAGRLACGAEGPGRMAEPAEILEAIEAVTEKSQ
jgi:phosphopantothenoylcysteine decarboxylase/phosphopantothenate--cysteine ligase